MSIKKCIIGKIEAGAINAEKGQIALDFMDELEASAIERMPQHEAKIHAASETEKRLRIEATRKRDLAEKQIIAADRVLYRMKTHHASQINGARAMVTPERTGKVATDNVYTRRETIRGQAHSMFADGLDRFRSKKAGFTRDRAGERAMVRELFGEATGDVSASEIAKSWADTAEFLRVRFNSAGGDIPKLEDWKLPQSHDFRKVSEVSADEWKNFIRPLLNREKMIDLETGAPMSEARLEFVLNDAYEAIRTDGLSRLNPGQNGGKKLANRRQEHRVFAFKDADAWIDYSDRFGSGDVFKTLTSHIDMMANDIAWLELFGPNPAAMKRFIIDTVKKDAALKAKPDGKGGVFTDKQKLNAKIKAFENEWDDVAGLTSAPVNARLAKTMSNVRGTMASAQLGSAFLSGFSDIGTNFLTARFNGLEASKVLKRQLRLMVNEGDQKAAVKLGLVADGWANIAGSSNRYAGEMFNDGIGSRLSEFTMRTSLLEPWTEAGRWAFGMEFAGALADVKLLKFADLSADLKSAFSRYGIREKDWNLIRKAEVFSHDGAEFVKVENVAKLGTPEAVDAATKLHGMIVTERDFAIITADPRVRAALQQGTRSGTATGEAARFFGMYKQFPITVLTSHLTRALNQKTFASKAGYAASMFIPMTVLGMASMQAKQVARGKDPIPMDTWKAWLAATTQGGGTGIVGDFLFSDQNRFGGGVWATIGGPGAGLLEEGVKFTVGNAQELIAGEDTHIGAEAVKLLGRYTPGSSLWYGRLAFERLILDQLTYAVDPKAEKYFRRIERRAKKENDQGYWWHRGDLAPERAPQL